MLKNFTSSMTGWLGAVKPDDDPPKDGEVPEKNENQNDNKDIHEKEAPVEKKDTQEKSTENSPTQPENPENKEPGDSDIQHQLDEMGTKALNTAKEWGTWLYGVGKTATTEVVKTAKTLKDTVEEKTILGEFQKEQEKYITENKEKKSKSEAAVPPWVGYNEEESMKKQILALSQDKRNFLRNPPAGVQFHFEYESMFPIATATLQEDHELEKMRFELVPKQVKEEMFWRNYFYRVSLIKQSAQLTSLAQQTDKSGWVICGSSGEAVEKKCQDTKPEEDKSEKEVTSQKKSEADQEPEDLPSNSPPDNEFISDAFQSDQFNEEDLKKEMQMLGMSNKEGQEDIPEWEKELQAELQEYEVVNDGDDDDNDLDAADLEQEILQQIEAESKQ